MMVCTRGMEGLERTALLRVYEVNCRVVRLLPNLYTVPDNMVLWATFVYFFRLFFFFRFFLVSDSETGTE